jgi:3-deoxy-manno-octulosonate cytidylyltransferase (CMP-KDO synthetase)
MNVQVYIPSRMASTRLPRKPLADIGGLPMICRVVDQAKKAFVGDVYVACDDEKIARAVADHGGSYIMTDSSLPSGSDRIWQAVQRNIEKGIEKPDIIINVQGDEPFLPPELLTEAVEAFELDWPDVVTFAHEISAEKEKSDPNIVKLVTDVHGQAHYFSRASIPYGAEVMKRHIGFYAYRYDALEKFVSQTPSPLEELEKLEQLRGLNIGLKYYVAMTNEAPIGIDTPEDLEKARSLVS